MLWARGAHAPAEVSSQGIAVDRSKNIYLLATFRESLSFDPFRKDSPKSNLSLSGKGETDAFLAKFESEGKLLWIKHVGAMNNTPGHVDMALDKDQNLWLTGYLFAADLEGFENWGQGNLEEVSGEEPELILTLINKDGENLRTQQPSVIGAHMYGLGLGDAGNRYMVGEYWTDEIYFGYGMWGNANMVIAKLGSDPEY